VSAHGFAPQQLSAERDHFKEQQKEAKTQAKKCFFVIRLKKKFF